MYTAQFILAIIFLSVGVVGFVWSIINVFTSKRAEWFLGSFIGCILILVGSLFVTGIPTKQDVLDGHAYYVKEVSITASDTITTYSIEWNNGYNPFTGQQQK